MRRVVLLLVWTPAIGLAALLVAEAGLRGLYAFASWRSEARPLLYERVYWATPPWVHRQSILIDDAELGLWMRPHAHREYINLFGPIGDLDEVGRLFEDLLPELPAWSNPSSIWHLDTNSGGMRDDEYRDEKPAGTFRIAVLGDSWTVGVNVERVETIPDRLERELAERHPDERFEVLNFGMIGAGVETGVRLLPRVLAAAPDVVVLAYAQNDEAPLARGIPPGSEGRAPRAKPGPWRETLASLEVGRLYEYLTARSRHSARATIEHALTTPGGVPLNGFRPTCVRPDVGRSYYAEALERLVAAVRVAGATPLLVYNNVPEFSSHCTLMSLRDVARRRRVPLLDSAELLAARATSIEQSVERDLQLASHPEIRDGSADGVDAVFRVDMSRVAPIGRPGIMGSHPSLGDFSPNQVALFDDGSHGDQVAGDRVFSGAFRFAEPLEVTYAFTNGARPGAWVGLENYRPRVFALREEDRGRTVYLPIAPFGRQVLRSDASHPDAEGYALIAEQLRELLETTPALRRHLARRDGLRGTRAPSASRPAPGRASPA